LSEQRRYFIDYSLKNGLGHPSPSLYLTGCDKPVKCEGCHNWELQEKSEDSYNIAKIKDELQELIEKSLGFSSGDNYFSILGGEPLTSYNVGITKEISEWVSENYPDITIVLYSWRRKDQIDSDIVCNIDIGILGSFENDKKKEDQIPGSTNQVIYDFNSGRELKPIKLK